MYVYVYMCDWVRVHIPKHMYGNQRTACGNCFTPPTTRVPGIESGSSGLVASAFTHKAHLPSPQHIFYSHKYDSHGGTHLPSSQLEYEFKFIPGYTG